MHRVWMDRQQFADWWNYIEINKETFACFVAAKRYADPDGIATIWLPSIQTEFKKRYLPSTN